MSANGREAVAGQPDMETRVSLIPLHLQVIYLDKYYPLYSARLVAGDRYRYAYDAIRKGDALTATTIGATTILSTSEC